MLVLSNEEISELLNMPDCIAMLEEAYKDLAAGKALYSPGRDNLAPCGREDAYYAFKHTGGTWPARRIQALRVKSDILSHPLIEGTPCRVKLPLAGGRWVGLVLLFSTETGELLSIFPDGVAQRMRVGGSSGLGIKYMARPDASRLALFGAGWQAASQLMAALAVRPIKEVKIYSLRRESREKFAREAVAKYGISIQAVATPEECVEGADIILAATSSMVPVIKAEWLKEGVHIGCIKPQEIDGAVLDGCNRVVVHVNDMNQPENVIPDTPAVIKSSGWWKSDKYRIEKFPDLAALISRRVSGREESKDVTCFYNNDGLGLQFAAVGSLILAQAMAKGKGVDLPREWFTESVHS